MKNVYKVTIIQVKNAEQFTKYKKSIVLLRMKYTWLYASKSYNYDNKS